MDEASSRRQPWAVLGVVYVALIAFAVVLQSVPPVLGLIRRDLGFSYSQAGLLMGTFAAAGIFLAVPGGFLADRYGARRVGLVSIGLMILGTTGVAFGRDFFVLVLGRMVAGAGGLVLPVIGAQLVSRAFESGRLGLAMSIESTAIPVGSILSFLLLGWAGAAFGWRAAMLAAMALSLLALVVFAAGLPDERPQADVPPRSLASALRLGGAGLWALGLTAFWFNSASMGALTFAPDYLVTQAYRPQTASFLTSLLVLGGLVAAPAVGLLIDKYKTKEFFISGGSLAMAGLFILMPTAGPWLIGVMLLLAFASAFIPVPLYVLGPELLPAEYLGLGFGVITSFMNLGIILGPWAVGLAHDAGGSYQYAFIVLAAFCLLAMAPMAWLYHYRKSARPAEAG